MIGSGSGSQCAPVPKVTGDTHGLRHAGVVLVTAGVAVFLLVLFILESGPAPVVGVTVWSIWIEEDFHAASEEWHLH